MADNTSLSDLLEKSETDLFGELWRQSSKEVRNARYAERKAFFDAAAERGVMFSLEPPTDEREGKWVFRHLEPKLRRLICVDWKACEKLNKAKYASEGELAAVLCDVLGTTLTGVPITIMSVLVVKIGVKHFCKCA